MKAVVMKIVGRQCDAAGEKDSVELITVGKCYLKNEIIYLIYQDSSVAGLENSMVTIKIQTDRVTINRSGVVQHKQVFSVGERYEGPYITQFGRIEMAVETKKLQIDLKDDLTGDLEIAYDLEVNGQWQSANQLFVTIQEDKENGHENSIANGD